MQQATVQFAQFAKRANSAVVGFAHTQLPTLRSSHLDTRLAGIPASEPTINPNGRMYSYGTDLGSCLGRGGKSGMIRRAEDVKSSWQN